MLLSVSSCDISATTPEYLHRHRVGHGYSVVHLFLEAKQYPPYPQHPACLAMLTRFMFSAACKGMAWEVHALACDPVFNPNHVAD